MRKRTWTEENLKEVVPKCVSYAQVCRELGLVPRGGNYKTVRECIKRLGLDDSHFTHQGWNVGDKAKLLGKTIPLEEILIEESQYSNSSSLRKRLLSAQIFEKKCYRCENTKWQSVDIPLELEHINGNNRDNRIENLTLLCPNCHALTPTYRGKNKGKTNAL